MDVTQKVNWGAVGIWLYYRLITADFHFLTPVFRFKNRVAEIGVADDRSAQFDNNFTEAHRNYAVGVLPGV